MLLPRFKTLPFATVATPDRGVPLNWRIARPGQPVHGEGGEGLVLEPITPRLADALRDAAGDIAEGTDPGRDTSAALIVASLLADHDQFQDRLAAAFGADACRVWIVEGGELRALTRTDAAPTAAIVAADAGSRVVVDDGQISTWVATWCARAPGEERSGLVALRHDGVVDAAAALAALHLIAGRIGVELGFLRLHRRMLAEQDRLRSTAMVEPLTGAWTRAAFERTVAIELAGARRRGEPLAVAVFDIDELRRVNDLHGHAAGDAVLAHVSAVIRANVRVNDEIGRFGDDELALLLIGADLDHAKPVIDKLVRKILDVPLFVAGERVCFTVRAGLTACGADDRSGDAAFARAVSALDAAAQTTTRVAICTDDAAPRRALDADAQVGSLVGSTLGGGYHVVHEINRGANGVVYRGEDLGLGRPVAIKVLRADLGQDATLVAKFRREASILASLRHPNLVEVYAFGAAEQVYFVMELVEGPTVADVIDDGLDRGEWLDADAVAELIHEVADALEAMHAAGLVHCDVKPENIVLDRNAQRAVLVDIGECKHGDEDRRRAGTPGYAAPESFGDGVETAAIDVYSLGATAYTMLTARLPFGIGDALTILSRQIDAPPIAPSQLRPLPAAVDAVLWKAMAVEPSQRFGTPGAFAAALRSAVRRTDASVAVPAIVIEDLAADRAGRLRELTMHSMMLSAAPAGQPMVRGAAFRVAAKVLAARNGEPSLRRIAEHRRDLGEVLQPTLAPMSWQPLALLLELIGQTTGAADYPELLRTIGRGTVSVTFGHVYGADPALVATDALLAAVPRLWDRYFDFATIEVVAGADHWVTLRTPGLDCTGYVGALVAGFLERIAELTGATGVTVGVMTDAQGTSFTVEWCDDARHGS